VRLANRAHSVDPLLVEPFWAKALAAFERNQPQQAFRYYQQAVGAQPKNPETWLQAGEFAFGLRCYQTAYTYLERYTELNNNAKPSAGADDYRHALKLVDLGKGRC
jgi:tetratricopeptide (TPR) repeat protein